MVGLTTLGLCLGYASALARPTSGGAPGMTTLTVSAASTEFVTSMAVSITGAGRGETVRYTLDGRTPGPEAATYSGPVRVSESATVAARSFRGLKAVSNTVRLRLEKVEPWAAVSPRRVEPGLNVAVFKGPFDSVRAIYGRRADSTAVAGEVSLDGADVEPHGRVFEGFVRVDATELHRFVLSGAGRGRVWVSGQLVVDGDGVGLEGAPSGWAPLAAGWHSLRVEWVGGGSEGRLALSVGVYGREPLPVEPSCLQRSARARRG